MKSFWANFFCLPPGAQFGQGSQFTQSTSSSFGQTTRGQGQAVNAGAGQGVFQGAGIGVTQGFGQGVSQGSGQAVIQGQGGFGQLDTIGQVRDFFIFRSCFIYENIILLVHAVPQ